MELKISSLYSMFNNILDTLIITNYFSSCRTLARASEF